MARVKGGFLGDLSGSVGNVTFARARGGISTARVRASPSNPRSSAQQRQRGRFKQLQRFASAFLSAGLIRPFWRPYATGGLSAYNAFMRANSGAMPDGIVPEAAFLSRSNGLEGVELAAVDLFPGDTNTYEFTIGSPTGGDDNNFLVGVIYNARTWQAMVIDGGAKRMDGTLEVPVSAAWIDDADALYAYAFAYQVEPAGGLRLSASSMKKVTDAPFEVDPPEVPAAQTVQEATYGQQAG